MILRLKEIRKEASDVYSFIFAPEQEITWQAGQYLRYTLNHANPDDRGISRFFTIASAPFEKNIQITTRISLEKGSSFKKSLMSLEPNATIDAFGPSGKFIIDKTAEKYVFIAGGIGITPFRSILLDLDANGQEIDVVLMYANRSEEIPFRDELEKLKLSHLKFRIEYFIGDEKIDMLAIQEVADFKDRMFYISGPQPMVEALSKTVRELGVEETCIKEDFFPGYETH